MARGDVPRLDLDIETHLILSELCPGPMDPNLIKKRWVFVEMPSWQQVSANLNTPMVATRIA